MASFFRLITHVIDVADDATVVTLVITDSAANVVSVGVTSWAVPQSGSVGDGESSATQVTSRPSSHAQHHSIGDGG